MNVKLQSGKFTNKLIINSKTDEPEYVLLFIPGGTKVNHVPFHLVTWWVEQKVDVAVFDHTENFVEMPARFRSSRDRRSMLLDAIEFLADKYKSKNIVCLGHSFGGIEAAHLAMTGNDKIKKVVISNGTWVNDPSASFFCKDGDIRNFNGAEVSIPTLIVHHANDLTKMCPYSIAEQHMEHLPGITVLNGFPHLGIWETDAGPHFYTGQEAAVFDNIHRWFKDESHSKYIG